MPFDPATYSVGGWKNYCINFVPTTPTVTIAFHGHPHFSDGTAATQGGAHIDNVSLIQCCDYLPSPWLEVVGYNAGALQLRFQAAPNLSYTVEATPALGGQWGAITNYGAQPVAHTVDLTVPAGGQATRFFRLRVP